MTDRQPTPQPTPQPTAPPPPPKPKPPFTFSMNESTTKEFGRVGTLVRTLRGLDSKQKVRFPFLWWRGKTNLDTVSTRQQGEELETEVSEEGKI